MQQIQLTENIYYVGVNDRHTDMFENHMELPNGVSYNSYLIFDEKVALIDPVEANFLEDYLFKVKSVLKDRKVDYLIINHDEPDHSSTVAAVLREYPEVQVVGNAKTFAPLEAFYGPIENKKVIAEGETLSLGCHTLQFFMLPMVHWPESMVTYEQSSKIVFSNDAFGGFGALNGGIFDDQVNLAFYEDEMRRYYANIVGKVAMQALKAIEKLSALEIKMHLAQQPGLGLGQIHTMEQARIGRRRGRRLWLDARQHSPHGRDCGAWRSRGRHQRGESLRCGQDRGVVHHERHLEIQRGCHRSVRSLWQHVPQHDPACPRNQRVQAKGQMLRHLRRHELERRRCEDSCQICRRRQMESRDRERRSQGGSHPRRGLGQTLQLGQDCCRGSEGLTSTLL